MSAQLGAKKQQLETLPLGNFVTVPFVRVMRCWVQKPAVPAGQRVSLAAARGITLSAATRTSTAHDIRFTASLLRFFGARRHGTTHWPRFVSCATLPTDPSQ